MKITVITVCFNSANTIEATIKSVIEQEFHDLEYIVIDGGSTDSTMSIVNQYSDHIDKCISEPDKGIFDAMNKGIELASGDVIAFLNSDDWYERNALRIVEDAFTDSYCDCVCCDNYVMGKDGSIVYYCGGNRSFDSLHYQMIYYHSAIFCRKDFFEKKENFKLEYKIAADYDWFLRTIENGAKVCRISQPVFTFRYGGISSVNVVECAKETRRIALRHLAVDKKEYRERIDDRFYWVASRATDSAIVRAELMKILDRDQINILWGAGVRGEQCAKWFRSMDIGIDTIVDSDRRRWGEKVQGIKVDSPDLLKSISCNLIITPERHIVDIKKAVSMIGAGNIRVFDLQCLCREIMKRVDILQNERER